MKEDITLKFSINFNRELFYQKKGKNKKILNIVIPISIIVILLIAVIVLPYRFYYKNAERIKREMKDRDMRIAEYQNTLTELTQKREGLSVVYSVINKFNVDNITWGDKLAALSKIISQDGWITDFHIRKKEGSGIAGVLSEGSEQLVIKGWVKGDIYKSLDKITKIIRTINSDPVFTQDIPFMNLAYSRSLSTNNGQDNQQNNMYKNKGDEHSRKNNYMEEEIVEFELSGDISKKGL